MSKILEENRKSHYTEILSYEKSEVTKIVHTWYRIDRDNVSLSEYIGYYYISDEKNNSMKEWLLMNTTSPWTVLYDGIYFSNESDATLFKLRWL